MHAILGTSEHCIAVHASDLCVALAALDTQVHIQGARGRRVVPLTAFYLLPGDRPDRETMLAHGELITAVDVPLPPPGTRSGYLKVRDRASYEFALTSAAAALVTDDGLITMARLALGGLGTIPWRAREAEEVLTGARRATRRSAPPRRPRCGTRSPSTAPRSRSNRPNEPSCASSRTWREPSHDRRYHRHRDRGRSRRPGGRAGQGDRRRPATRPTSATRTWPTRRWCSPPLPPGRSAGSTPDRRWPRPVSWPSSPTRTARR
jgi:FAD binding domain in molybdopterin dehydrogenase/CO dehydrogenase flavoprotein C-terminal domain